jgi:D-alanyl-D-alanine carboxypeptidase
MSRTVYRNASGLPDGDQVTTARDQVLLGRALQDRFPRFYRYFSIASFSYGGRAMRNHNHLLGRVTGVDGIKTGYTNASGFNLVANVHRGNRHIVAAVFGGRTARTRDARMRDLIEEYIDEASTQRTAARIMETPDASEAGMRKPRFPTEAAPAHTESTSSVTAFAAPGSFEPIRAVPVKTLSVRPGQRPAPAMAETSATAAPIAQGPGVVPPIITAALAEETISPAPIPVTAPVTAPAIAPVAAPAISNPSNSRILARGGWLIQIGAFSEEAEAKQRLQTALSTAKGVLGKADPFTERVVKGDKTFYRARFAGFDKDRAEAACKHLKRNEFACLALKN